MKYLLAVLVSAVAATKVDQMSLYSGEQEERVTPLTVGVLTLPTSQGNLPLMNGYGHYITEMNDIFLRAGGLTPVAIPYNASDKDLY